MGSAGEPAMADPVAARGEASAAMVRVGGVCGAGVRGGYLVISLTLRPRL